MHHLSPRRRGHVRVHPEAQHIRELAARLVVAVEGEVGAHGGDVAQRAGDDGKDVPAR